MITRALYDDTSTVIYLRPRRSAPTRLFLRVFTFRPEVEESLAESHREVGEEKGYVTGRRSKDQREERREKRLRIGSSRGFAPNGERRYQWGSNEGEKRELDVTPEIREVTTRRKIDG